MKFFQLSKLYSFKCINYWRAFLIKRHFACQFSILLLYFPHHTIYFILDQMVEADINIWLSFLISFSIHKIKQTCLPTYLLPFDNSSFPQMQFSHFWQFQNSQQTSVYYYPTMSTTVSAGILVRIYYLLIWLWKAGRPVRWLCFYSM